MNNITLWTGNGAHASALAIDWNGAGSSDESLVWGYLWDTPGTTTEDMLHAVLQADNRLYAKLSGPQPWGISVFGLGHDTNQDGRFAISDGTSFDADGIAITGTGAADGATPIPPDQYAEGWFDAYWHLGVADTNPFAPGNGWATAKSGISTRLLQPGSWDSLAIDVNFSLDDFANNPIPAPHLLRCDLDANAMCNTDDIQALYDHPWGSPPSNPMFDLTRDMIVDGNDLNEWLIVAGAAHGHASIYLRGDHNLDRSVDISDFNVLSAHFAPLGSAGVKPRWEDGNFDGNGQIDITDFNWLSSNFSPSGYATPVDLSFLTVNGPHSRAHVVPEPHSAVWWLISITVVGWGLRPQGRRGTTQIT